MYNAKTAVKIVNSIIVTRMYDQEHNIFDVELYITTPEKTHIGFASMTSDNTNHLTPNGNSVCSWLSKDVVDVLDELPEIYHYDLMANIILLTNKIYSHAQKMGQLAEATS